MNISTRFLCQLELTVSHAAHCKFPVHAALNPATDIPPALSPALHEFNMHSSDLGLVMIVNCGSVHSFIVYLMF